MRETKNPVLPLKLTSQLGKRSDRVLAIESNISVHFVRKERIRRGIRAWQFVEWTKEKIAVLGTMPDKNAAKVIGVTSSAAFSKRVSLGIPAFGKSRTEVRTHWAPFGLKRLGTISDRAIAGKMGISESIVTSKRHSMGIASSNGRGRPRRQWTKRELAMLGTKPDTIVAVETGRGRRHIRAKRESLGIPAFQQQKTIQWNKQIIRRMAKMTNAELARDLGVSQGTVALHRRRLLGKRQPKATR